MKDPAPLYRQLLQLLSQYSHYQDWRHLKTLAWMVHALICSETLNLPDWEPYVTSVAQQAQSYERRWSRFIHNPRIMIEALYLPLVLAAISRWGDQRLYLSMDTTLLWNQFCMIHISVVCGGRALPLLWDVVEKKSASAAFEEYYPLLRKARWLLRHHPDIMLLADRGFAPPQLFVWLQKGPWHWCIRLPCDVEVTGVFHHSVQLHWLWPRVGEAKLYHQVKLWCEAQLKVNLVLAYPKGVDEPWAVATDEPPSLKTLWQYAARFRVEELFLDSKSGAFELEDSKFRCVQSLQRLYLVAALALLYGTMPGMAIQVTGLRRLVDPHWHRGLSYLKIGLRWLRGVLHKGRPLLEVKPLLPIDPEPCFASKKARWDYYDKIWFTRIQTLKCQI